MIRKLGFVVLAAALIVSACGRQITPNPPVLGPPNGFMQFTFSVNGTLNFAQYSYVMVFNTNGNPNNAAQSSPLANATQTNYQNYSFAIVATNVNGQPAVSAYQFVPLNGNPNIAPSFENVPVVSGQVIPNFDSNGQQTQFSVSFLRNLACYFPTGATPAPTSSATASPTPTPTASPSSSPTSSPSTSPSSSPCTDLGSTWYFNAFTVNGNVGQGSVAVTQQTLLDSMGSGGPTDTSWVSPSLSVNTTFITPTIYAKTPINPPSDPASQINNIIISNTNTMP